MRIACVHQGYELYGSDRSFIESVTAIRAAYPGAEIEVVLPRAGPIVAPLSAVASRIVFEPIWVLRRRNLARLATLGMLALPAALATATRRLRASDLVYVNTSVVTDYLLAARLTPGKTIVHVHEIPEGPALPILRSLLRWSRADIVFNSQATRTAFALPPAPTQHVIYNGVAGPDAVALQDYDGVRPLRVLMLGRISRIKGQEVLIEALERLPAEIRGRLDVRIVGSAFEDPERERMLAGLVGSDALSGIVALSPFTDDPSPLFRWADVVVVPSRRPESLGRVAIEAMAYGRPPLASAIGGLCEIVDDERTGWLVAPDRADVLAERLRAIVTTPEAWAGFGAAARRRYDEIFSETAATAAIQALIADVLGRRSPGRPGPLDLSATLPRDAVR